MNTNQTLKELSKIPISLPKILTEERISTYQIQNTYLNFNYAATQITPAILEAFQNLADEKKVIQKYSNLVAGDIVNQSEQRAVQHHLTRTPLNINDYTNFCEQVRSGEYRGHTGHRFESIVQVGIGGSDLGPRAVCDALIHSGITPSFTPYFLANIDPAEWHDILSKINLETTLFIIVSKSGTTQETCSNLALIQSIFNEKKHFISVTMPGTPFDNPEKFAHCFHMDETIGGRFCVTSAGGGVLLSLLFGSTHFEHFLKGAYALDQNAKEQNILKNMSLLAALIGLWNRTYLNLPELAIVPYGTAFEWWPLYLQQLFCESLGKSIDINQNPLQQQVSPIVFGSIGSCAQHAYFQQLHQGQIPIPVHFIAAKMPEKINQNDEEIAYNMLLKNMSAQIIALASTNRPSTLVQCAQLTPETLGALVAFYENIVMFQGFLWEINAFDQPGVELGKTLVKDTNITTQEQKLITTYLSLFSNTKPRKNTV